MEQFRALTIDRLNRLNDQRKQISFAYLACNRMIQNYQYFARNSGWGNEYILIDALGIIQKFVLGSPGDFDKKQLLSAIYENIPNSNKFPSAASAYAENAASSVYYTLNSIPKVDIQQLSWALVLSRDTIDTFIQVDNNFAYEYNDEFEEKIRHHWMMRREFEKQENDFSALMKLHEIDEAILEDLKVFNNGKSIIDVSPSDISI